jgi:hypothetical protein
MKRYRYAWTHELFKKNLGVLAKYIRKGTPWMEDHKAKINPENIKTFYTELWGTSPNITVPFEQRTHVNDMFQRSLLCHYHNRHKRVDKSSQKRLCPRTGRYREETSTTNKSEGIYKTPFQHPANKQTSADGME